MYHVRAKWHAIGIKLNVDTGTLDGIRTSNNDRCTNCLTDLIKHWLEQPAASWEGLVEALESDSIDEKTLAQKIRGTCIACTSNEPDEKRPKFKESNIESSGKPFALILILQKTLMLFPLFR